MADLHVTAPTRAHWQIVGALRHAAPVALQVRHAGHGQRRYNGMLAPYYRVTHLTRPPERFAWGCWKDSLSRRGGRHLPLLYQHVRETPIGHVEAIRDETDGLHGVLVFADSAAGTKALDEVQSGSLRALSVGFAPIKHFDSANGIRTIEEAELGECSLVGVPAYSSAGIDINTPPGPSETDLIRRDAMAWRALRSQVEYELKFPNAPAYRRGASVSGKGLAGRSGAQR